MSDKIILPDIGEGIDQVEISEISVNVGDHVDADEVGLIVETEEGPVAITGDGLANAKVISTNINANDIILL